MHLRHLYRTPRILFWVAVKGSASARGSWAQAQRRCKYCAMATFSVQGMELDADGDQSESGGLGLLREELSEQDQEPPYENQGIPSGTAQAAVPEQVNGDQSGVQERARAWGQSVSRSFMGEGHAGSTEGETELVPDYASMPSQPQTPQHDWPAVNSSDADDE